MRFYFLLHWSILILIVYLSLLIFPVRLKVIAFRWLVSTFIKHHHVGKNRGKNKKKEIIEGPLTITYPNEKMQEGSFSNDQTAAGIPGRKGGGS